MQWDNYYDVLSVDPNANSSEIKKAYAARIKKYSNEQFPDEFIKIREAYDVLSNEASRKEYDKSLNQQNWYHEQLQNARREISQGNYEAAYRTLEGLQREFPDDRVVALEFEHVRSRSGSSNHSSSSSDSSASTQPPEKKEKEKSSIWGCCICLIIIFVIYKLNS